MNGYRTLREPQPRPKESQTEVMECTHIVIFIATFYGQRYLTKGAKFTKVPILDVLMVA